ncbi:MAG: VCBS repeat-containing protein [Alphaproteobacteria bacterium]|nr:VCBS repeat-containing protein [Alphaproteobacteria bacterium]
MAFADRHAAAALALLCLGGCIVDYDVNPKDDNLPPADDTGQGWGLVEYPEDETLACDETPVALAEEVGTDETCVFEPTVGEIESQVEWSVSDFGAYPGYDEILMAPVVGQLSDDDGDGIIGEGDVPDVVVIAHDPDLRSDQSPHAVLRVLQGDTGQTVLSVHVLRDDADNQIFPYRFSNVALGDIDLDGLPDMVYLAHILWAPPDESGGGGGEDSAPPAEDSGEPRDSEDTGYVPQVDPNLPTPPEGGLNCNPVAIHHDGTLAWVAYDVTLPCGGHAPALADLEGDGDVEVVVGAAIMEGADGSVVGIGADGVGHYLAYTEIGLHSVIGDLDGDGVQEIIAGNTVYDPSGGEICSTGEDDGFAAYADLDLDGQGDFVVVGNGHARVYNYACQHQADWSLSGGGTGGPPTIADFDGDGLPEIGIADAGVYAVYEPDGTELWATAVTDASSHATGSAVFDFEFDGYPEVVYADETALRIYDGATGEVRLEDTHHSSRTLHELPTIVDVDDDGETEIVVVNGGGHYDTHYTGLYVLGSLNGDWLGNRTVWNQHAYNIVNINDDLSIPSPPEPNWPNHNNFRSGDPNPVYGGQSPDAVPLAELCDLECEDGVLVLDVAIGNAGMAPLRDGIPVSVYSQQGSVQTYIDSAWTEDYIQPGEVSARARFRLDPTQFPEGTLVVAVDEYLGQQYVNECHEDNNTVTVRNARCPSR